MKTRSEVSAEKLRGGFYTPPRLVRHALERLSEIMGQGAELDVLEPSVGDGAFIEGICASPIRVRNFIGVEVLASEAAKASTRLDASSMSGTVVTASTLAWSLETPDQAFDAVIGNLPFVRFQFVAEEDRRNASQHATEMGLSIGGVSNLWLPMLLASLRKLRVGGGFVLVLPAECLTGVSAGSARQWLLNNVDSLRCDIYPAGSFPGALQEVLLLSGRMAAAGRGRSQLTVASHSLLHSEEDFSHSAAAVTVHEVPLGPTSWTRYLLKPSHIEALEEFEDLPVVHALGSVAKFEVATVTGANAFFSLTATEVERYDLHAWARPLLPRTRHAPGLIYGAADYDRMVRADVPSFIFDASRAATDRLSHDGLNAFLAAGEEQGLHTRFKCRIRSPWWAVPGIRRGDLFLSKRCHRHPRMILNETEAITTDTIYRGRLLTSQEKTRHNLVAGFHNSGTLLSAELEGRNFGGGVLELVPSEVSRLKVPLAAEMGDEIGRLDRIAREMSSTTSGDDLGDTLRHETDLLLRKAGVGITGRMLDGLAEGRSLLVTRRLDRGSASRLGDM